PTLGGPYFVQTTVPLFLLLLFLMGVGPLLPWRRASPEQVRRRVTVPAAAGAAVVVGLALAGVRNLAAAAAFGMAAFVGVANATELARGVMAYRRATGRPRGRSAIETIGRNRRLYGGLVAHLGFAVVAVAVTASSSFARQTEVTLGRGDQTA